MTDAGIKKASLWRETWQAMKQSLPVFWPWVLGLGVIIAIPYYLFHAAGDSPLAQQLHDNPDLFKQHPELAGEYMHETFGRLWWLVPVLVLESVGYYTFTVTYLQSAMKNNRPTLSVKGYFYWFRKTFWKYIRPILWVLIPIIGFFFYLRSLIRYLLVGPLAVIGRGDELKTSWALTKDNWWRIFGNSLMIALLMMIIAFGIFVVPLVVIYLLGHSAPHNIVFSVAINLAEGLWVAAAVAANSIYACTVYRILSQEGR